MFVLRPQAQITMHDVSNVEIYDNNRWYNQSVIRLEVVVAMADHPDIVVGEQYWTSVDVEYWSGESWIASTAVFFNGTDGTLSLVSVQPVIHARRVNLMLYACNFLV